MFGGLECTGLHQIHEFCHSCCLWWYNYTEMVTTLEGFGGLAVHCLHQIHEFCHSCCLWWYNCTEILTTLEDLVAWSALFAPNLQSVAVVASGGTTALKYLLHQKVWWPGVHWLHHRTLFRDFSATELLYTCKSTTLEDLCLGGRSPEAYGSRRVCVCVCVCVCLSVSLSRAFLCNG